ncbi:MAG: N-acetyl-gamma-glutamyl-phosphate reductase [Succinivibrio sp.]
MKRAVVIGASGYAGAEICRILSGHGQCSLNGLYVSENSADKGRRLSDLYGSLRGICDMVLEPTPDPGEIASKADFAFLATDHKVSHDLAAPLVDRGVAVFDLSGAFRISDTEVFEKAYGFPHEHKDLLAKAVYALAEYVDPQKLRSTLMISLPGCYPTASQLALRPLIEGGALDLSYRPSINAVSGVTGSGRKAKLSNSFCEVSLNAYGVFAHRHQPEIEEHLGAKVVFTPHLGPFKRGILATITARLNQGFGPERIRSLYEEAYRGRRLVRLLDGMPRLQDVQGLPFCDIGFKCSGDGYIVVCSAIDNLLKGAAAQAVQVMNIYCGFDEAAGLL